MNRKGVTFYIDNVLYIERFRIARKCDFNMFNEDSLVSLLFMFLYRFPNCDLQSWVFHNFTALLIEKGLQWGRGN